MACFALAYTGFAVTDETILALCFAAAGIAIGCVETASTPPQPRSLPTEHDSRVE